jgi:hypothetical protein
MMDDPLTANIPDFVPSKRAPKKTPHKNGEANGNNVDNSMPVSEEVPEKASKKKKRKRDTKTHTALKPNTRFNLADHDKTQDNQTNKIKALFKQVQSTMTGDTNGMFKLTDETAILLDNLRIVIADKLIKCLNGINSTDKTKTLDDKKMLQAIRTTLPFALVHPSLDYVSKAKASYNSSRATDKENGDSVKRTAESRSNLLLKVSRTRKKLSRSCKGADVPIGGSTPIILTAAEQHLVTWIIVITFLYKCTYEKPKLRAGGKVSGVKIYPRDVMCAVEYDNNKYTSLKGMFKDVIWSGCGVPSREI